MILWQTQRRKPWISWMLATAASSWWWKNGWSMALAKNHCLYLIQLNLKLGMYMLNIWLFNIAMEKHHAINFGKPSINGPSIPWRTVSHNQRVNISESMATWPMVMDGSWLQAICPSWTILSPTSWSTTTQRWQWDSTDLGRIGDLK